MKKLNLLALFSGLCALTFSLPLIAQDKPLSPKMSASEMVGSAKITINYNAPSVRGRKIWGELVPFDKVWRTGANEATTFTTDKDIMLDGKSLKAGTYALLTIPKANEWVIIFNTNTSMWGSNGYDQAKDALRLTVKPTMGTSVTEQMKFAVGKDGKVSLAWEKVTVSFTVKA